MSTAARSEHTRRHAGIEQLRRTRRRIADDDVAHVLERLERGGITPLAAAWLRRERGRPATLSAEGLLAGLFLTAADNRGAIVLTRVTDTLYFEISPRMRARFGINPKADTDRGFEAAYAVVRRRFRALLTACDPSPLPKNKRLPRAEAAKLTSEAGPALLAERRARLVHLTGLIIEDSLEPVRDQLDQHWDGSVAVDGNAVRAFSKGLRSTGPVTATDPDAAWHVRTGDHAEPDAADKGGKQKRKTEMKYGFEATLAACRNPQRDGAPLPNGRANPSVLPALTLGFILDKPGHAPGPNATTVLADVRRRGHRPGWLAGDRLFNNSTPDDFQLPIRALGYRPVFDYTVDQLGVQDQALGALQIEGAWYCPSMPPAPDRRHPRPARRAHRPGHVEGTHPRPRTVQALPQRTPRRRRPPAPLLPCQRRQGALPTQTPARPEPPVPPPATPGRPAARPDRTPEDLPPGQHHPATRGRREARPGPRLRRPGIDSGLLPAAQQHRINQWICERWGARGHRSRGHPPHPRHRRPVPAAGLPTAPREHSQDRKLARHPDRPRRNTPRRRPTRRRKTKPITDWTPAGYLRALPEAA